MNSFLFSEFVSSSAFESLVSGTQVYRLPQATVISTYRSVALSVPKSIMWMATPKGTIEQIFLAYAPPVI